MKNEIFVNGSFDALLALSDKDLKPVLAFKLSNLLDQFSDLRKNFFKVRDEIITKYGDPVEGELNRFTFKDEVKGVVESELNELSEVDIGKFSKLEVKVCELPDMKSRDLSLLKVFVNFVE